MPKLLQQQILSSFSMQQALKLVQPATHLDEFVSNRPLEEQFKTDYQKYYAQDYFIDSVKRYAEISQGNAMLIGDSLSQQEINFRTPFLDA